MDYQIRLPDYISKCINKDRPELHCNGQCVLMKKLKETEDKEANKNLVAYEYSSLYTLNGHFAFTVPQPEEEAGQDRFLPNAITYRFNHNTAIFRPPITMS